MKKFFIYILLIICVAGCGIATSFISTAPPIVKLEVNGEIYPTAQGSYCWNNKNVGECADMVSPTEIVKDTSPIIFGPGDIITILVDRKPYDQGLTIENEGVDTEMNNNTFTAPEDKGTYIYMYYARWNDDGSGTSGDSSYVFKIEVK